MENKVMSNVVKVVEQVRRISETAMVESIELSWTERSVGDTYRVLPIIKIKINHDRV